MLDIDNPNGQTEESSIIVRMYINYTTSSGGVGKRTYRALNKYVIDKFLLAEMMEHKELLGEKSYGHYSEGRRPEYEIISVIPKITRPISSDGVNTFSLVSGQEIVVPSNVATYLSETGQAA